MSFINHEDGYYTLTTAGTIATIVLVAVFLILTAFIRSKSASTEENQENGGSTTKKSLFSTKQMVFSAVSIALAFALSYVQLVNMPWGGSVTLCSMFFVTIVGYWFGAGVGFSAAFAYGLLQFIQSGGSYMLSPMQICMDYFFAFMALGASGFFKNKKNGLVIGYVVAILLRGVFHTIGGYLYWMDYMPENFPASLASVYPILYNYAYILVEGIITVVIISIPAVKKGIAQVSREAKSN